MGSRANFAIIGEQGLELYYDHWSAQCLSLDLVLDGETATIARVRQMRRLNADDPDSWLDDKWAEGALVLDLAPRRLIWFDNEGLRPRLAAHLIERTWDGWSAIWAPEGMRAILGQLGIAAAPVLGGGSPARSAGENSLRGLDACREYETSEGGAPRIEHYFQNTAVLSVRFEDASVWPVAVGAGLHGLATYRWDQVVGYAERARAAGRRGAGEGGAWAVDADHPADAWAEEGVHVDVAARRLSWWSNFFRTRHFASFARNWPGFEVVTLGDDYQWQQRAAGISGIQPPLGDLLTWEHERLTRRAGNAPQANPAGSSAAVLADHGYHVQLSPWTAAHVPAARVSGRQQTFAELDALIAAGAGRLPRARYIDSSGRIIEPGEER